MGITLYFVQYDAEDGSRVWWHESVSRTGCEFLVEFLEEQGRNPTPFSYAVSDPVALAPQEAPS